MNKYAEYKEAYKALIKESAGIKDFINKGILPAFSKSKAIEAGTSKIDDLLANSKAKIYPKKNVEGSIEQLLYNKSDANSNAALIKAVEEAVSNSRRNVGIGVGGAAALGGAGYGTYKALEPEETTTDKIMNTLRNVFAQANSEYTESLIKKAYAAELIKNAGMLDKGKLALEKYLANLSGARVNKLNTAKTNLIKSPDIKNVPDQKILGMNKKLDQLTALRDKTRTNTALGLGAVGAGAAGVSALTPEKSPQEKVMDQLRSLMG